MKDVVEKAFGNIKERLNIRRLLVSSEKGLDGKIFMEFVALILVSYLDHKMKESGLYMLQQKMHLIADISKKNIRTKFILRIRKDIQRKKMNFLQNSMRKKLIKEVDLI